MIEERKKPTPSPEFHKVRFIVRRSSNDEFTYADVRAMVARTEQRHDSHFFDDLSNAVTAWVIKDPEGKEWWRRETSEDANIGDLAQLFVGGAPQSLREELEKVGITDLEIDTFCYDDAAAWWTYDMHLVDEGEVVAAEDEEG